MNSNIKYDFDSSLSVMFKCYCGVITIADIESSWLYAFENDLIPEATIGFVLDYRKATFNIGIEEHTAIPAFYKKHIAYFKNKKIAIVTDDPKNIVVPILVKEQDDGYTSEPFSTMDAAIEWVAS